MLDKHRHRHELASGTPGNETVAQHSRAAMADLVMISIYAAKARTRSEANRKRPSTFFTACTVTVSGFTKG